MSKTRTAINTDWIDQFNHRVVADRVPVSGMIELTRRCNLKCVHCYLGEGADRSGHGEMTTEQVFDVVDQITAAGCLYLTITGGDPMMRKDFPEVYRHAKESGLLVTVMCDGVLVTKKVVDFAIAKVDSIPDPPIPPWILFRQELVGSLYSYHTTADGVAGR